MTPTGARTDQHVTPVIGHAVGPLDHVADYGELGVRHILSGPDHVLFVVILLLAAQSARAVCTLTLTFTVAHSITLLLAGVGAITVSPRVVEPVIAFSVAVAAIACAYGAGRDSAGHLWYRIAAVFCFGLFHGLGFAGLLREGAVPDDRLVLSLLSFNAGVELGQLIIVVWSLPVLLLLRATRWRDAAVRTIGVGIALIGIFWGLERTLAA